VKTVPETLSTFGNDAKVDFDGRFILSPMGDGGFVGATANGYLQTYYGRASIAT
jgi:hypothetical protein